MSFLSHADGVDHEHDQALLRIGGDRCEPAAWAGGRFGGLGKVFFIQYGCFQCHGTVGQGGNAGPKIAPDPLPYEALANFVRTTNRQMPPYREAVLPNEDLADIYAYLQSVPKTPDYKTIPLLND